jgi:hypothetical protein
MVYKKETVSNVIHQAIGEASMCWFPRPTGEFDSAMATDIAARLIADLNLDSDQAVDR